MCFVLVFILSFDACIVTITWSRLFLVISSADEETLGYTHGRGVRVYYLQ
jgi:hypothetical protein